MVVELTENEIKLFNQNGIKTADIQETVNNYRTDGLSDDAIRAKVDAKLNSWKQPNNTTLKGGISKNANWDKKGNVYYTDENGNKIDTGLNPIQKLGRKARSIADNTLSTINSTMPEALKQKTEATAAALTLPLGGSAALTSKLASKLAPIAGKKIAQGIAGGTLSGGISGGAYGALNGITNGITDEKSAIDTLKQSGLSALGYGGLGALTGGTLGLAGGKIMQGIEGKNLRNAQTLSRTDKKNLRELGKDYYKNYIQQTTSNQKDLGRIYYGNDGLSETLTQQVENAKNFPDLKNKIKNAEYIGEEKLTHPRKDNIIKFHRLRNGGEDFLIGETKNGKKYYLSKDTEKEIKKAVSDDLTDQAPKGLPDTTANIITNSPENFNPDMLSKEFKQSRLPKGANLPEEIKKAVKKNPPEYEVLHNKDLINEARSTIANNGDLSGAKEGAAIGGALGGAFPIIGGAYNNLKKAASPLVGKITGLKPETLSGQYNPTAWRLI